MRKKDELCTHKAEESGWDMILNPRSVDGFVLEEGLLFLQSREWKRMSKEKDPRQVLVSMREVEKVHFILTSIFSINVGSQVTDRK